MTYHELVEKLKKEYAKLDASKIKEHVAIQFNVTGEAEGALYLEIADGQLKIEPYEYYDRDILVTISEENLLAIAEGRLKILDAYNDGKLTAEGDLAKAVVLKEITPTGSEEKKTLAQKMEEAVAVTKAVTKATSSKRYKKNRKRK